ncbi:MAG: TonB-dependent receptor [Ideonella sp.]|nr:TonB-dependent receptor [Ideonella sp.]
MDLAINGKGMLAGMEHRYSVGLLRSRFTARFNRQAYNWVGVGTLDGLSLTPPTPASATKTPTATSAATVAPAGCRFDHPRGQRLVWTAPQRTRSSQCSHRRLARHRLHPILHHALAGALSHAVGPHGMAYTSWGEGVESRRGPGAQPPTNAGQALPAMKSRQVEAGYKHHGTALDWNLAAFDIRHPEWIDMGTCDVAGSCMRTLDGASRHRGIEADAGGAAAHGACAAAPCC